MTDETIRELLLRKIDFARDDLKNAYIQKQLDIAKADQRIAVCSEIRDAYENLLELDWKTYAKNELEAK